MKQYLSPCLFLLFLFVLSCTNHTEKNETKSDSLDAALKFAMHADSISNLKKDSLKNYSIFDSLYFICDRLKKSNSPEEIKTNLSILATLKSSASAKLDSSFHNDYAEDYDRFEKYVKTITDKTSPLSFIWIEESTRAYLTFNWAGMLAIANATSSKADDHYFRINNDIYEGAGEYSIRMPVWIKMKTDISGSSRLGDSTFLKTLARIDSFQIEDKEVFVEEYKAMRNNLVADMVDMCMFENRKEGVLRELNQIASLDFLTEEEKAKIKQRIKELNDSDNTCQFNCGEADCRYE